MNVDIEIKAFSELCKQELYDLLVLRNRIFVVGQKITSELEADGRDPEGHHVLMRGDDEVIGTARIFMDKVPAEVGRICVETSFQGAGLGSRMMKVIQEFLGDRSAALHAQAHLEEWYAKLGWERSGAVFEEAGIPHVQMEWLRCE